MKMFEQVNISAAMKGTPMSAKEIDDHENCNRIWATIVECRREAQELVRESWQLGYWDGHIHPGSQELGARGPPCVSAPPVSAVQRTTGPSGEWGYGARCLCWARAPSGSATRQRVVPTDRHSFVVCQ